VIAASLSDAAHFGAIFDRHFAEINRYLARRVGLVLADEIAAETFVIAFRSRDHYQPGNPDARPWLYGIAANLARRHWRTERRRLRAYARTGVDPIGDEAAEIDRRVDAAAAGPELAAALASLSAGLGGPQLPGDLACARDSRRHGSLAAVPGSPTRPGTALAERASVG
jgi:RNA polymerase sigma-70 factor (ECF subfamily)